MQVAAASEEVYVKYKNTNNAFQVGNRKDTWGPEVYSSLVLHRLNICKVLDTNLKIKFTGQSGEGLFQNDSSLCQLT